MPDYITFIIFMFTVFGMFWATKAVPYLPVRGTTGPIRYIAIAGNIERIVTIACITCAGLLCSVGEFHAVPDYFICAAMSAGVFIIAEIKIREIKRRCNQTN